VAWTSLPAGAPPREVLAKFISVEHRQAALNRFFQFYREHFDEIQLYPGMRELLFRLKEKGAKPILFTGGGHISTDL
jgi:phosphoserine phosphatase